jgi:phytoene dehydrogenase-like protein
MKRRAFIGGLTTTALAGACEREPTPPTIGFVGQSPERGHAIRDGALRTDTVHERVSVEILVVGAGVAGAAACWRLARAGHRDTMLLELEPDVGGTARSGATARSPYPMGAHYLPSPHPSFGALHLLLDDLGLVLGRDRQGRPDLDPTAICRAPVERHRHRGLWSEGVYPAAGQTADEEAQWERWQSHLRELDGRVGGDGRRLFDLPVDLSSTELRHLDAISMAQYLDGLGLDSWRLRWAVDYACRDDYGCTLSQTSAFAGLHHDLARGLEDMHDRVLLVWPEGNARLVHEMLARTELGDRRRTDHAVVRIDPDAGTALAWDLAAERMLVIEAQVILWAAPRFLLRHVIPRDPLPRDALTYAPWLTASIELDRAPAGIGAPLSWDNVSVGADHLGYVVATHGEPLDATSAGAGAVVTYYEPFPADSPAALAQRRTELLAGTAEQFGARVTAALEDMHPGIERSIRRIDVARWGHGMIRPTPGLLFGNALAQAATPIDRVLPCAADVGGLPLFEQAFFNGVRAAEAGLSRLGRPVDTIVRGHA